MLAVLRRAGVVGRYTQRLPATLCAARAALAPSPRAAPHAFTFRPASLRLLCSAAPPSGSDGSDGSSGYEAPPGLKRLLLLKNGRLILDPPYLASGGLRAAALPAKAVDSNGNPVPRRVLKRMPPLAQRRKIRRLKQKRRRRLRDLLRHRTPTKRGKKGKKEFKKKK